MKGSSNLFAFIKALSPSEKRYFKVYATQSHQNSKNYLLLFDYINQQSTYDEKQLKDHFKGSIAKNLPSEKNYLLQMVLKSMRAYHSGKTAASRLQEYIKDLYFLGEKRNFEACKSILKKAKKIAARFELFSEWLKLLRFERRFIKFLYQKKKQLGERLQALAEEQREIRRIFDIEYQYIELYDELLVKVRFRLHRSQKSDQEYARKQLERPILQSSGTKLSFHAQSYFFLCRAYCYQILGNKMGIFNCYQENIDLWKANPHRIKDEPYQFQRAISNYLGCCYQMDRLDLFKTELDLMNRLPQRSLNEKAEHFSNYYYYYFLFHLNQQDFSEALGKLPEIIKNLSRFEKLIPLSRLVAFNYNIAVVYFMTGGYSKCIKWLVPILNGNFGDVRSDLRRNGILLQLACHYELRNIELYSSLLRSSVTSLKRDEGILPEEQIMLDFFKDILLKTKEKLSVPERALIALKSLDETSLQNSEIYHWLKKLCRS